MSAVQAGEMSAAKPLSASIASRPIPSIDGLGELTVVGSGGFATVYAADDVEFGRRVAVKVLHSVHDEDGRRRFDRERKLMGSLGDHPNVVTPYRFGVTDSGHPFLVMEYLQGGSLHDLVRQGGRPWPEASKLILPIADALGRAHAAGFLHRDVKPANILLTAEGVAKLSDFGIAGMRSETSDQLALSLAHCPPEAFVGGHDQRDERSDLYSLASTLFALVTGSPPFATEGEDSAPAFMRRIEAKPVPATGHGERDAFFASALAKDPADRPPDADAFVAALSTVGADESAPPMALAPSPALTAAFVQIDPQRATGLDSDPVPEPVGKGAAPHGVSDQTPWYRRRTGIAMGAGLVVAILGGVLAVMLLADQDNESPSTPQLRAAALAESADAAPVPDEVRQALLVEAELDVPDDPASPVVTAPPSSSGASEEDAPDGGATATEPAAELPVDAADQSPTATEDPVNEQGEEPTTPPTTATSSTTMTPTTGSGPTSSPSTTSTSTTSPDSNSPTTSPAEPIFEEAYALYLERDYSDAMERLDDALAVDPNHAPSHKQRSVILRTTGKRSEAIEAATRAIESDPTYWLGWYNRAIAYRLVGNYEAAIADLDVAASLEPNSAGVYGQRAQTYEAAGQPALAAQNYDRALELDPNRVSTLFLRARFRGEQGNLAGAKLDLERFMQLAPRSDNRRDEAEDWLEELDRGRNPFD